MLNFIKKHWKWILSFLVGLMALFVAILAWQYPKTNIIQGSNLNMFKGSIFDLAKKISSEDVMFIKEEMAQKNNGLIVQDKGYITNLSLTNSKYLVFIKNATSSEDTILCQFDNKWGDTLKSIVIPDEIFFEGKIDSSSDFILLKNCIIK